MTDVTEVAPDLFRLCTWIPEADLQFCSSSSAMTSRCSSTPE